MKGMIATLHVKKTLPVPSEVKTLVEILVEMVCIRGSLSAHSMFFFSLFSCDLLLSFPPLPVYYGIF